MNTNMKILFAVYDAFSHDQRAMETIECLSKLGEVTVVSYDKLDSIRNVNYVISGHGKRKYLSFRRTLIRTYKKFRPEIVFLHDNYTAFFINWLRKKKQNVIIGYDSSELYYDKFELNKNGLKGAFLNLEEKKYLKYADFVLAANVERAMIMKDVFQLEKCPKVWDNIHRIDDAIDIEKCEKKYDHLFEDNKNVVFYCGGIHKRRGTFDLIDAVNCLGDQYKLIIAGTVNKNELNEYEQKLKDNNRNNIKYVGFVSRAELKYLLHKSKISVSIFDLSCVNQLFCASGKVYEAIFENVPVLTSINPPFKRLCNDHQVGISTDNYSEGIKEIIDHYDYYVENTKKLVDQLDYDNRISKLTELIKSSIDGVKRRINNE